LLDRQLLDDVARLLSQWGVPASCLGLEITESSIMIDPMLARVVLNTLSEMGVGLAIDDFGTDHSSLAYLKPLSVDEMKIDKSFVLGMATNENDAVIVRSTVALGRSLGLRVVAEGIETNEILQVLTTLGCDIGQGYHVSRPRDADAVTEWTRGFQRSLPAVPPVPAVVAGLLTS
jgi:EAL domain-containing protein (putative c-di-GMP-specific phosphodiesterase class I)